MTGPPAYQTTPGFYSSYESEKNGVNSAVCGPCETERDAYDEALDLYERYER